MRNAGRWPADGLKKVKNRQFNQPYLMLNWSLAFLVVALIAAILGFGAIAGTAATIAKVLFIVFLVLFLVALISGRRSA
jgi:uncharacterized membrane protein YtjA (UPF0391 family)